MDDDRSPAEGPARERPEALPVLVALGGPHARSVRRHVEHAAGWQPVDAATAALVPPALRLVDVAAAPLPGDGPPVVLLVDEGDDPVAAARAAAASGAGEVLRWPDERDRLPTVAARLARRPPVPAVLELGVGGASGGVGTTTVALALAGLVAWQAGPTLLLTHGAVPAPAGPTRRPVDLAGAGTWEQAVPVPGVDGLRLVRTGRPAGDPPVDAGAAGLVVRDLGVEWGADVLVLRRDGAGLEALRDSGCAIAVVVDTGPAPDRALRAAAAGRRTVVVPVSARVARAGLAGRVPAGLPGRWLAALRPVLAGGDPRARARPVVTRQEPGPQE